MTREYNEFRQTFASLLSNDSDVVVIHSALWTFAHRFGLKAGTVADAVLTLIREACGPDRTIVFPTYSFSFCRTGIFDLSRTPSETGILSSAALANNEATRTHQPIYSNALIGARANELVQLTAATAWGTGSAMEWLARQRARYVTLGVPWHLSASLIHSAEERVEVPYRYFKRFTGRLDLNGDYIADTSETMFVRSMYLPPDLDYSPATRAIEALPSFRRGESQNFPMEAANADDIVMCALNLLHRNPYTFVRNRREVESWVTSMRRKEIAELSFAARPQSVALTE